MANIGMVIELLEKFRDRDMWIEGFMTHDDKPKTRKNICGYAIETIINQQAEIEQLKNQDIEKQEELESIIETLESDLHETLDIVANRGNVVRCKDCKHYRYYGLSEETVSECTIDHCEKPDGNWFCADGEPETH